MPLLQWTCTPRAVRLGAFCYSGHVSGPEYRRRWAAKLLLATGNPGKARELARLLRSSPWELVGLRDAGVDFEVDEVGETLEENAALKAKTYARHSGLWALADDSGLEVEALGGAPGVRSRRFAGEGASDADLVRELLRRLDGTPWKQRGARFRSVIAIASPRGELHLCQGVCDGVIDFQPQGGGGFGYDPVFFLPDLGCTMAELSMEEKNRISHRAAAARVAEALLATLRPTDQES